MYLRARIRCRFGVGMDMLMLKVIAEAIMRMMAIHALDVLGGKPGCRRGGKFVLQVYLSIHCMI